MKLKSLLTEKVSVDKQKAKKLLLPVIKTIIENSIIQSNIYSVDYASEFVESLLRAM